MCFSLIFLFFRSKFIDKKDSYILNYIPKFLKFFNKKISKYHLTSFDVSIVSFIIQQFPIQISRQNNIAISRIKFRAIPSKFIGRASCSAVNISNNPKITKNDERKRARV